MQPDEERGSRRREKGGLNGGQWLQLNFNFDCKMESAD